MEKLKLQLGILKEMKIKPNYAELARKYNKDWRTIKKYDEGYVGKSPRRNKASKLDEFKEEIKIKMSYTGVNVNAVYQFFVDKYGEKAKGYNNFLNYVKKNHFIKTTPKSSPRFETSYGVQAQVDWKESLSLVSKYGEIFEFNVFAMILSASRKVYYEYSVTKTRNDVFRCIINALNSFGGVTDEILFDNMSSIVDISTNKTNVKVMQFAKDFGFRVRRCRAYRAQTKGYAKSFFM